MKYVIPIAFALMLINLIGVYAGEEKKQSPFNLIDAATTRPWPGRNYPVLPSVSTEMQQKVANEIAASTKVRDSYSLLDAKNKRNVDWFEGVKKLEELKASWPLALCLCHPSEDVQIHTLRALGHLGNEDVVPFVILYAEYMAVWEEGSENATIHGIIHKSIAQTLSSLTGIEVKIDGQNVPEIKKGIKKWRKWLVEHEDKETR